MVPASCGYFKVEAHTDNRGTLWKPEVPFEVKNSFYVTGLNGQNRGGHAHRKATQALWCIKGDLYAVLENSGTRQIISVIPSYAIVIPPRTWVTLSKFSPDCCYAVWSSEPYDEGDVVRDPNEFFKWYGRFPSAVQTIAGELVVGDAFGAL